MSMPQNLLLKIHGMLDSLKSAERRLADYIVEHPRETVNATIEELAVKSGASYATISRFCKKMGLSGYKEFRNALVFDITEDNDNSSLFKTLAESGEGAFRKASGMIFDFTTRLLNDTFEVLDEKLLEETVNRLIKARRVVCVGAGTSEISAKYAYTRFFRLGISAYFEADHLLASMLAATLGPDDLLFAVSSSGRTSSTLKCAEYALNAGAGVIALVDFGESPLAELADLVVCSTPRSSRIFEEIELTQIVSQITVIDIIYASACLQQTGQARTFYRATRRVIDESKK